MKKIKAIGIAVALFTVLLVGCSSGNDDKNAEPSASFDDIVTAIKEQIANDLEENGVDDALVDGQLAAYMETDLTATEESNPGVTFWIEKMELNQDELANGRVIAAMMNINSDEIILLEAKDEKDVPSLKEALERELEAQVQTWQQYLPDQLEKVQNNVIQTKGNFLLYVTYSDPDKITEVFEASFK